MTQGQGRSKEREEYGRVWLDASISVCPRVLLRVVLGATRSWGPWEGVPGENGEVDSGGTRAQGAACETSEWRGVRSRVPHAQVF